MKRVAVILGIGLALLGFWIRLAAQLPKISIPDTTDVESVEFTSSDGSDADGLKIEIREQNRIAEMLSLIGNQNLNWKKTWHTFPTPKHRIIVYGPEKKLLFVIWLGEGWIGARDRNEEDRLHPISQRELQEFLAFAPRNPTMEHQP